MLTWLSAHAATIVISLALAVIVFFIVRGLVRGRIKTCDSGSCGSACSQCPMGGSCHGGNP